MRRILLVCLLIVFSVQGLIVATGGRAFALSVAAQDEGREAAGALDAGQVQVDADIEEMSDYVPPAMVAARPDRCTMTIPPHTPPLVSVDLPRAPPPPRA